MLIGAALSVAALTAAVLTVRPPACNHASLRSEGFPIVPPAFDMGQYRPEPNELRAKACR